MPKRQPAKRAARKSKPVKRRSGDKQRATPEEKPIDSLAAKRLLYESFTHRIAKREALKSSEIKQFRAIASELERPDEPGGSGEILATTDDAATYCGVSKRVISGDVSKGKLKRNADGTFNKSELNRYIAKYRRGKADDQGDGAAVESIREQQEKAELRYRLAKARKEELLADQLEKTLIPKSEVVFRWGERVVIVKNSLQAWKDRLPALLVGRARDEMQRIIDGEVRDLLVSFERRGEYCPAVKAKARRNGKGY